MKIDIGLNSSCCCWLQLRWFCFCTFSLLELIVIRMPIWLFSVWLWRRNVLQATVMGIFSMFSFKCPYWMCCNIIATVFLCVTVDKINFSMCYYSCLYNHHCTHLQYICDQVPCFFNFFFDFFDSRSFCCVMCSELVFFLSACLLSWPPFHSHPAFVFNDAVDGVCNYIYKQWCGTAPFAQKENKQVLTRPSKHAIS